MRINSNTMANTASRNLTVSQSALSKSLERLSSGMRINKAADDAAGLVISQGLRAQISGLQQASRNAQDGVSVVQTAEGALSEVQNMLNRMRDLSVQAANTGTNDTNARAAANAEVTALKSEIDRITNSTSFGSQKLLDGTFGTTAVQRSGFTTTASITVLSTDSIGVTVNGGVARTVNLVGGTYTSGASFAAMVQAAVRTNLASSGVAADQTAAANFSATSSNVGNGFAMTFSNTGLTTINIADGGTAPLVTKAGFGGTTQLLGLMAAAVAGGGAFQVGSGNTGNDQILVNIAAVNTAGLGITGIDVSTGSGASFAIGLLDAAISSVSTTRGNLGAVQNRFESAIANLGVTTENLSASESRIRDTDMSSEMTNFTKNQILQQAGTAMLAQANQIPQTVLKLLG